MSAQATRTDDTPSFPYFESIAEEDEEDENQDEEVGPTKDADPPSKLDVNPRDPQSQSQSYLLAAQKELQVHELVALFSCFLFPAIGAWMLHAIRSQLSRPSEGLVSDYNLTIFLLAAEVRPVRHLVKMVLARTLHLQRIVRSSAVEEDRIDAGKVLDIVKRMEELEAHIADSAEDAQKKIGGTDEMFTAKALSHATSEMRKSFQPELDALNRAVRRYEKRTTISAIQTESRIQELESRLKDVVVLAAAAQRSADTQPRNFILVLANGLCGAIVLPFQYISYLLSLPFRAVQRITAPLGRLLGGKRYKGGKDAKAGRQGSSTRPRERKVR